jgi:hypothetical protein
MSDFNFFPQPRYSIRSRFSLFLVMATTTTPPDDGAPIRSSKNPAYISWQSMNARCGNPNRPQWIYYGGRGIKVCESWLNSFTNFVADMGPRPPGHSLERIDPAKDYEIGNCRWARIGARPSACHTTHSKALCFVRGKKRGCVKFRCRSCDE